MLNQLLGPIDAPAAFVMLCICGMSAIVGSIALLRPTARAAQLHHDIQMATLNGNNDLLAMQKKFEHERELAKIASQREVEFKRIDTGMIELQTAEQRRAEREG